MSLEERIKTLEAKLENSDDGDRLTRGLAICGVVAGLLGLVGPTLSGVASLRKVDGQQGTDAHERTVESYKELRGVYAERQDADAERQLSSRYEAYLLTCLNLRRDQDRIVELASTEIDENVVRAPLTERQLKLAELLERTRGMPGLDSRDYFSRGMAYFEVREYDQAREALEEAVRLDSDDEAARTAAEKLRRLLE